MMIEMVNSKRFEKRYKQYYGVGLFDRYVDRLIENFQKTGKEIEFIDVFEKDMVILRKRAVDDYQVKFIKAKAWYEFW